MMAQSPSAPSAMYRQDVKPRVARREVQEAAVGSSPWTIESKGPGTSHVPASDNRGL